MILDILISYWKPLCIVVCILILVDRARELYHVPGPWSTLLSNLELLWHEHRHDKTMWIHSLHARYGPVVRLSTTEVHCNSMDAVKAIYGVRTSTIKDPYYEVFNNGTLNMFSTSDDAKHAEMKRRVASYYAYSHIWDTKSTKIVRDKVNLLSTLIANQGDGASVKVYHVLSYLTLDVVSAIVFGNDHCAGALSGNELTRKRVHNDIDCLKSRDWPRFWRKSGYTVLSKFSKWWNVLVSNIPLSRQAETEIDGVDAFITEAAESSAKDPDNQDTTSSLVGRLVVQDNAAKYILSEARDHVLAGSDTTTTVLTFLLHALAKHLEVCAILRTSLLALPKGEDGEIDVDILDNSDELEAVVNEGLRMYAAIPMTLPRILLQGKTILGVPLPAGISIGAQCYSLHRDPLIFSNPELFDPSRWKSATSAMQAQMWAFSSGSRSCIGKALAVLEIKMAVAKIICSYMLEADPSSCKLEMYEDTTRLTMVPRDTNFTMLFRKIHT